MKKLILISVLFSAIIVTVASPIIQFKSWDDLIQSSSDILIVARHNAVAQPQVSRSTNNPVVIQTIDGGMPYPVEIISVLKGNAKSGPAELFAPYSPRLGELPHQGNMYLVFVSNHEGDQKYPWYRANENYRIVFIAPDIYSGAWTNAIAGRLLKEQIRIMLESRLSSIDEELKSDQEEKKRVEDGLKELH